MTRSVAEIIGWEYVDSPHEERMVRTPDGQLWYITKKPTPDDLLAWLREQYVAVYPCDKLGDPLSLTASPVTMNVLHDVHNHWIEAPTLLAALEAAVRAVAGES